MNKLIHTFQKNKFEQVQVEVKEFKGYDLLDIRVYTSSKEGGNMIPTGKGVSINISHFPELKMAITKTESFLKENNLLNE